MSHHCQNGHADLCLLARYCEITCPADSCDIDDGMVDWPTPPPGPFSVEIWEVPGHWDAVASTPDFLEAAHLASYLTRRDWRVHGNESRVQILDGDGRAC